MSLDAAHKQNIKTNQNCILQLLYVIYMYF